MRCACRSPSGSGLPWPIRSILPPSVMPASLRCCLLAPILLRWHHFLLIVTWNLPGITIFFLPGRPPVWLLLFTAPEPGHFPAAADHQWEGHASSPTPLSPVRAAVIFHLAVLFFTAKLTGGIGLHSMERVSGGKKKLCHPVFRDSGYFATARSPDSAQTCKALYQPVFSDVSLSQIVGDLYGHLPSALNHYLCVLSGDRLSAVEAAPGMTDFHAPRYAGLGPAGFGRSMLDAGLVWAEGNFALGQTVALGLVQPVCGPNILGGFSDLDASCI